MIVFLDVQPPPRDVTTLTFTDLTPVAVVGYPVGDGGDLPFGQHIEFASDLDPQTYRLVKLRAQADTNTAAMQDKAFTAITANNNFLALTSPTNAQVLAQVQRLTRECTALIRLLLTIDDSSAGT